MINGNENKNQSLGGRSKQDKGKGNKEREGAQVREEKGREKGGRRE